MERKSVDGSLKKRIREGRLQRQDVARRLAELAFGKANDCVRLVLEEDPCVEKLDLSLLSEVKRSEKGMVEIKLIDRLQVLECLAEMTGENGTELESFLQALQNGDGT